ncbi:hypothetical protein COCMIDRAFT_97436, partial [Bipolaris oryzae ATCC 44560]
AIVSTLPGPHLEPRHVWNHDPPGTIRTRKVQRKHNAVPCTSSKGIPTPGAGGWVWYATTQTRSKKPTDMKSLSGGLDRPNSPWHNILF